MKKKFLTILMAFIMCIGLCLAFSGCNNDTVNYKDENVSILNVKIKYCKDTEWEAANLQLYKYQYTINTNLTPDELYSVAVKIEFKTNEGYIARTINYSTEILGNDNSTVNGYIFIDLIAFKKGIELIPNVVSVIYNKQLPPF